MDQSIKFDHLGSERLSTFAIEVQEQYTLNI